MNPSRSSNSLISDFEGYTGSPPTRIGDGVRAKGHWERERRKKRNTWLSVVSAGIWKSIPLAYPSYIYGMSVACLWCTFAISTNSIPMACLSCMSMTYLWDIYGIAAAYLSMIYLQIVNLWLSMAYLWHQSMILLHIVYVWLAYGLPMACL